MSSTRESPVTKSTLSSPTIPRSTEPIYSGAPSPTRKSRRYQDQRHPSTQVAGGLTAAAHVRSRASGIAATPILSVHAARDASASRVTQQQPTRTSRVQAPSCETIQVGDSRVQELPGTTLGQLLARYRRAGTLSTTSRRCRTCPRGMICPNHRPTISRPRHQHLTLVVGLFKR